jgi:hypothetical protein
MVPDRDPAPLYPVFQSRRPQCETCKTLNIHAPGPVLACPAQLVFRTGPPTKKCYKTLQHCCDRIPTRRVSSHPVFHAASPQCKIVEQLQHCACGPVARRVSGTSCVRRSRPSAKKYMTLQHCCDRAATQLVSNRPVFHAARINAKKRPDASTFMHVPGTCGRACPTT